MSTKGDISVREKRQASVIVGLSFFLTLIVSMIVCVLFAVHLSGIEMNQPGDRNLLVLLVGTSICSSVLSWFVWLLVGRLIFGGSKFYDLIKKSSYPFFIPGSDLSKMVGPISTGYDGLARRILGISDTSDSAK